MYSDKCVYICVCMCAYVRTLHVFASKAFVEWLSTFQMMNCITKATLIIIIGSMVITIIGFSWLAL